MCACRCRSRSFAYCCFSVLISRASRSRSLLGAIACNAPIVEGIRSGIDHFFKRAVDISQCDIVNLLGQNIFNRNLK